MYKPVVHYRTDMPSVFNGVGRPALLWPVDHSNHVPGQSVSNKHLVKTSDVVAFDVHTGRIETLNTIYMPMQPLHALDRLASEFPEYFKQVRP